MAIFYALFSELLYVSLFFVEPLRRSLGETGIALKSNTIFLSVIGVLAVLTVVYIQGFTDILEKISLKKIVVFSLIFQATLFVLLPMGSDDVYSYIYKARVLSVHHLNPYVVPYDDVQDMFSSLLSNYWSDNVAVYGPVFMSFATFITFIGGNHIFLQVYLFKLFAVAANIGVLFLLYKITRSKKAVYLYAWNPYINFIIALDGHNDIYLSFFLLLSFYFLSLPPRFKNYFFSSVSFVVSILIKYFSIAVAPLFALFFLRNLVRKEKIKKLFAIGVSSLVLIALFYLPFWDGPAPFRRIFELSQLQEKSTSPLIFVVANMLFYLKDPNFFETAATIAKFVFIGLYTLLVVFILRKKSFEFSSLVRNSLIVFFLFFFVFSVWFLPWYSSIVSLLIVLYYGFSDNKELPKILFGLTFFQLIFSVITR